MQGRDLETLARERYGNPDVAAAVIQDARERGTVERIEKGELTLPSEHDAENWHRAKTGQAQEQQAKDRTTETLADLERRVAALEQNQNNPDHPPKRR